MISLLTISEIEIEVERKKIKNMHLAVYPPDARVHLSMPDYLTDDDAKAFIIQKWEWVRKQREEVLAQPRQTERQYVSGESHFLFGKRYELLVEELPHYPNVIQMKGKKIYMLVKPDTTTEQRATIMREWYRAQLKNQLDTTIKRWAERLGETNYNWQVKQMKTEWGSCVKSKRMLIFNLELARVPIEYLEFVVVHEFCHFVIDNHNKLFEALMTKRLPNWRTLRKQLNDFIALPYKE